MITLSSATQALKLILLTQSKSGDDVIVPPTVSTEDAKKKFGEVREVKP